MNQALLQIFVMITVAHGSYFWVFNASGSFSAAQM